MVVFEGYLIELKNMQANNQLIAQCSDHYYYKKTEVTSKERLQKIQLKRYQKLQHEKTYTINELNKTYTK